MPKKKYTIEIFPEWVAMLKDLGLTRKTAWKILGHENLTAYDSAMTRMKKAGVLTKKYKLVLKIYNLTKARKRKKAKPFY